MHLGINGFLATIRQAKDGGQNFSLKDFSYLHKDNFRSDYFLLYSWSYFLIIARCLSFKALAWKKVIPIAPLSCACFIASSKSAILSP